LGKYNLNIMVTVTIPKEKIQRQKGVVILPLKEYQKLCKRAALTYYLKDKKAEELDKLVKKGLKEYRQGKCKTLKSLADLD